MPVRYKDKEQEADVQHKVRDLLDNCKEALENNDIDAVYKWLFDDDQSEGFGVDRLGKLTEIFLELNTHLLDNLTEIFPGMFFGVDLTSITLPATLQKIGVCAFGDSKIKEINFNGTEQQWYDIVKNSPEQWDRIDKEGHKVADSVVVNCSDKKDIYSNSKQKELEEAMTAKEVVFKRNVLDFLRQDGFPTFADYLSHFHFNFLTSNEAGQPFVAAIAPAKGIILINPNIDADSISMVLRHEAAHQIFMHMQHMFAKLKKLGIDTPSELAYKLSNIVGDYHISNFIYDEDDKDIAKHIKVEDGEELAGLVTELDFPEHPEYWTMDFDELWEIFVKDYNPDDLNAKAQKNSNQGQQELSQEFVDGWNALIDAYNNGEITKEQIETWYKQHGGM